MTEVAIVGMGAVFPGAVDAPAFWRNIHAGVDAITEVPPDRWDPDVYYAPGETGDDRFYCRRGGFIDDLADFDPTPFGIMPAAVHGIEPDQLLALRAAAEAIADCGSLPDRERVGVIIGRGGYLTPGVARLDQRVHAARQLTAVLRDLVPALSPERIDAVRDAFRERLGRGGDSIGLVPNFAASRLANRFDLRGPAYTVDAACASSLVAVDHAVRELAGGRCDAVLAGGVHTCHHPTLWSVFTQLRALSAGQKIRPFDRNADGTLLSEGAGVVLLKRLADATAAGDRVYAVIRGVGVASDGRATSMMNPLAEGQELAMRRAWAAAGLDPGAPGALGLLEAHGTATPVGDQVELTALGRVFGPASGPPAGVGTVKSMIGHAMPAAGIAGLIKAALAVYHEVLPPTLNVSEPHPALAGGRFKLVTTARPWPEDAPRRAAVSAFGFGGINAHVILEASATATAPAARRLPRPAAPAPGPGEMILRLAAGSVAELRERLEVPDSQLIALANREPGRGDCRLAIVAPDGRRLALARKVAARGTSWRGRGDIWFTPRPLLAGGGQVAFLFPGFEPEFAPRLEGIAEHFGLPAPRLHGDNKGGLAVGPASSGDAVGAHARDIIAVSRLLTAALGELGIRPDVLAGHSLGEWTAMIVAGIYPEIDTFMASMRPGMVEVPDLVYAALGMPADRAGELVADHSEVVVTHDNCPRQSVVCGPAAGVADIVARARAAGIMAQTLPFRTGFHSPMFAPYLAAARDTLRQLEVRPARLPVWSATSLAAYPADPEGVRDLVLRHLVEPVRFRPLTQLLHESGVRAFVQVGPGSLTGFAADTLRDREHLAVATAVPQHDGLGQLRRVAAALWTEGMSPRFDRLGGAGPSGHPPDPPGGSTGRGGIRLRLGAPLVRLAGVVPAAGAEPPIRPAGSGGAGVAGQTVALAEFDALLAETAAAAGAVALARTSPRQDQVPAAAEQITMPREFSLSTMPELSDHRIIPQAEGWPDDSDWFPVVPMTTLLEVMADAAAALVPGRVVVGFEQVAAMRWLTVAPATMSQVHAARVGPDRVAVRIEGYASGYVLVADAYPPPLAAAAAALREERPAPVSAAELYAGRWMFHGSRFAGVADIASVAADGIRGTVVSLPARGALLDSAGQLIGHWMQVSRDTDQTVLPTGIGAVRLYAPQPPSGHRLDCTAWIREVTGTEMRADAELRTGDDRVWCRIENWTTRRFATDDAIWRVKFRPESNTLSRVLPGGWNVLVERWPDTASRELMMRRYLNSAERAGYERLNPLEQRQWLLGRIASKDSVRRWLWDRGAGPIYPAEVTVDGTGDQLRARGPFRAPLVSLAYHRSGGPAPACVVAVAGDEPAEFTVEAGDDGALLVRQPGMAAWPVDVAAQDAAGSGTFSD